jgi:hypothetical protein
MKSQGSTKSQLAGTWFAQDAAPFLVSWQSRFGVRHMVVLRVGFLCCLVMGMVLSASGNALARCGRVDQSQAWRTASVTELIVWKAGFDRSGRVQSLRNPNGNLLEEERHASVDPDQGHCTSCRCPRQEDRPSGPDSDFLHSNPSPFLMAGSVGVRVRWNPPIGHLSLEDSTFFGESLAVLDRPPKG